MRPEAYKALVSIIGIAALLVYGIELARLGIDSTVAMVIGGTIGAVAGASIKKLKELLG